MTNNPGILDSYSPYYGTDKVQIGDGKQLAITHIGHKIFPTKLRTYVLRNVLVVPEICKNLISVRRFTFDNSFSMNYDSLGVFVKEPPTQTTIVCCRSSLFFQC
ncbi:hypothetical protein ACH5RR_001432 [Cinchona calisaya]|uniref:Retrovirus-related Pol polyprotein from transposon TNT 1-94-like beta-barrel domain-containing protein n=1 Tax=Cinchona calisaya TaxID=153742 RepID=A0ABD3B3M6_9GENT